MKTIKVSKATPIQLDWLVNNIRYGYAVISGGRIYAPAENPNLGYALPQLCPSSDWAQGGPLIEKELINLITTAGYPWRATVYMGGGVWIDQEGPTPLIAAMRCYVCSRMGETVEVPEELT